MELQSNSVMFGKHRFTFDCWIAIFQHTNLGENIDWGREFRLMHHTLKRHVWRSSRISMHFIQLPNVHTVQFIQQASQCPFETSRRIQRIDALLLSGPSLLRATWFGLPLQNCDLHRPVGRYDIPAAPAPSCMRHSVCESPRAIAFTLRFSISVF